MNFIFSVFVLCSTIFLAAGQDPDDFVATKEWQPVREGQKIPAGLHIRLNLETGEREAKLLDPEEKSSTSVVATTSPDAQEEISRANLEKAFANLDLSRDDVSPESHVDEIRRKFRSYDELKKEFEELNLKVQTDQEILRELMDRLNGTSDHDERKTILTDLEYYLHQYDNGIFFADNNGLTLLLQFLNSTEIPAEIRQLTSLVLGAAFQGNPQVQLKGLHLGFVQSLVRLLNGEHDEQTKLRLIYPLSTLLRNFPPAQKQFVDHGGAEAMVNILDWKHSNNKLAVRTIALMNDLIVEKDQAVDGRRAAYENLHLFEQLVERGWCSALVNRLEVLDFDDFDSVEKVLRAFLPFRQQCRNEFDVVRPIFSRIEQTYPKDDTLYNDLFADLSLLQQTSREKSSDEL